MNEYRKNGTYTKKRIYGGLLISLISFFLLIVMARTSSNINERRYQLPYEREIFEIYQMDNISMIISFDMYNAPPVIQIVNPEGVSIDMNRIRKRIGSNFKQYFIPDAIPGKWKMRYNPNESDINVVYISYDTHIFIRDFWANRTKTENGKIPATFYVSSDKNSAFEYTLYAVVTAEDNSIEKQIMLTSGVYETNSMLQQELDIGELEPGFMLLLEVYQDGMTDTAWKDLRMGW